MQHVAPGAGRPRNSRWGRRRYGGNEDTMNSIQQHAVYNPRITLVLILLLRFLRAVGFLLLAVLFLNGLTVTAADWTAPEAQLASKIVATTGPGTVALEIANH